ncbi:MAG TPA: ATP-dependent DNA helicase RecG [Anaerolineae bacterium]|nr:ATP-dependent DNA helicase RecG [Anaerolineae bacterium]
MAAAYQKLDKMLELERRQGYRNKAVIGGLEALAPRWRAEAGEVAPSADLAAVDRIAALLAGYASAGADERSEIIAHALSLLGQLTAGAQADRARTEGARLPARAPASAAAETALPPLKPVAASVTAKRRAAAGLEAPVSALPGVKSAYAQKLGRLGIITVNDLLHHYPHRYEDYSSLKAISHLMYGEETTVIATVIAVNSRETRSGGSIVRCTVSDGTGSIDAVWFNQPFLARQMREGRKVVLSGRVAEYLGHLSLQSPAWEPLESDLIHTGRLVPVYPLTSGIGARWLRKLIKQVVDHWAPRLIDHLPPGVRERHGLADLPTAIRQIHFPETQEAALRARQRLSFDEFLLIQLGLMGQRARWKTQQALPVPTSRELLQRFLSSLPYTLTGAQMRCLEEVLRDLAEPEPMSRLLQGDVGSGKTVIAAAAMLQTLAAGRQAALMAPTEILAQQHYETLCELLGRSEWGRSRPPSVALLTGSLQRAAKARTLEAVASGEADIAVGTHALIQQGVEFSHLGFVVVDEQHRFGVVQRASLREKGQSPHLLVMSATPIPRSLALTVYGDLDVSLIDEMPPGRQRIVTRWLLPKDREGAYAFIRDQVSRGRQAFVLYPLIEESEKLEIRAAVDEYERLQASVFADLRLGLLHGKMRSRDKDSVMQAFRQGEIQILVSTSVIEVGIDVPNATVMLIEGADRFGLAQLHQFRGRVGRGAHQSYCLLLSDSASPDDPQTRATWERLMAIEQTQDGFALAEKDLDLRGPGDFFGVRQSGLPTLRLASLSNLETLERARQEARTLFSTDPQLSRPEHSLLRDRLAEFWVVQGDLS